MGNKEKKRRKWRERVKKGVVGTERAKNKEKRRGGKKEMGKLLK